MIELDDTDRAILRALVADATHSAAHSAAGSACRSRRPGGASSGWRRRA
jgi:hypothetical protein